MSCVNIYDGKLRRTELYNQGGSNTNLEGMLSMGLPRLVYSKLISCVLNSNDYALLGFGNDL